jgi:MoaA/NifB/PqqE/SkfB family radical SAM enzyme
MKEFEMSLGSLCNFRCRYCYENGEGTDCSQTEVSMEDLLRWAEYIRWSKINVIREEPVKITIFGGEPTLQLDKIDKFIGRVYNWVDVLNITTNGSLSEDVKSRLLNLKKYKNHLNLKIHVSYDFTNQDTMRQKNTYDVVRDNIRWLYNNMGTRRIITVFTQSNFHTVSDVFFDFIKLREELPNLVTNFNIDRFGDISEDFDEKPIRESLQKVKDFISENPQHANSFFYNPCVGLKRGSLEHDGCFYRGLFASLNDDGCIYPGYDVTFESEKVQKLMYLGHVNDDFESIEKRRVDLVNSVDFTPNPLCVKCDAPCRVFPWRVIKNDLSEYNNIPEGGHCKVHKLFGEYIPAPSVEA